MALEIVFLDGAPVMEIGARTRIRVLQRDAEGELNPMLLRDVSFSYSPLDWGRVEPTDDPAVGVLEVVRLVESEDLLLAPTYSISASLTTFTGHTFQAERRVRLLATALEVELAFEVGQHGKWRRFKAADLRQPIDWSKARVGDPSTQSFVVRDGVPYLRLTSLDALPAEVAITFPNGEVARLVVDGRLAATIPGQAPAPAPAPVPSPAPAPWSPVEAAPPVAVAPPPAAAPEPAPAAPEPEPAPIDVPAPAPAQEPLPDPVAAAPSPAGDVDIREEITRLRRYVASFAGTLRARPDPKVSEGIRQRIQREVDRVRGLIEQHGGPEREELVAQLEAATAAAPVPAAR